MKKIGEYMREEHYLRDQDIADILLYQQKIGKGGLEAKFGEASVSLEMATPSQVNKALLKQKEGAIDSLNLGALLHSLGDIDDRVYADLVKTCGDNDESWEIAVLDRKLVSPERLKNVQETIGLARHTYLRDIARSRFMPFNVMEPLLLEKIDYVFEETGQCSCAQCWNNVFAIAVNDLPSRYISYSPHILEYVGRFRPEYSDDILRVLRAAAARVRKNPKLSCASLNRPDPEAILDAGAGCEVIVRVSNRHIHLCQADLDALFGTGYNLRKMKDLMQPGQYAAEETVELIGPKGRLSKVRVLGPVRPQTQVEISGTDQFVLGVRAPVRESGDTADSPGIRLAGPAGEVDIKEGLIRAMRHIHMPAKDAESAGLVNGDMVSVRIVGDRPGVFQKTLIRVSDKYGLEMHVDTDEANAVGMPAEAIGKIIAD